MKGSIIDGFFVSTDAITPGSCPPSGIKYLPKSGGGGATTTTTTVDSTSTGVPSRGTISVLVSGTKIGGLLSYGTWSTQTSGTMTATASGSGFTLTSSRGMCGVISGGLTCGSSVTASVFTLVSRACYHLFRITQLFVPLDDLGEQQALDLRGVDCVHSRQYPQRVDSNCSLYWFRPCRRCHTRVCLGSKRGLCTTKTKLGIIENPR